MVEQLHENILKTIRLERQKAPVINLNVCLQKPIFETQHSKYMASYL